MREFGLRNWLGGKGIERRGGFIEVCIYTGGFKSSTSSKKIPA